MEELTLEEVQNVAGALSLVCVAEMVEGGISFFTGFWRGAKAGWRAFENYSD
jgi:hypothetical protein